MNDNQHAPCFLYKKGKWMIGEWYHQLALYEWIIRQITYPSNEMELISISRPGMEPFCAYFSEDKGQFFFMELNAESTDDIIFITMTTPQDI